MRFECLTGLGVRVSREEIEQMLVENMTGIAMSNFS
jgi:hypothetical protein